jgi:hypothetical protein
MKSHERRYEQVGGITFWRYRGREDDTFFMVAQTVSPSFTLTRRMARRMARRSCIDGLIRRRLGLCLLSS